MECLCDVMDMYDTFSFLDTHLLYHSYEIPVSRLFIRWWK